MDHVQEGINETGMRTAAAAKPEPDSKKQM
jgi:hypothetical protein